MHNKFIADDRPNSGDISGNIGRCQILVTARRAVDIPAAADDTVFIVSSYAQNDYQRPSGIYKDMLKKYGGSISALYAKYTARHLSLGDITYIPATQKTPHLLYVHTIPRLLKEQAKAPEAILAALRQSSELLAGQAQLARIVLPLLGTSINSNFSPEVSLKLLLHSLYVNQNKLTGKQVIIALHASNEFMLPYAAALLQSRDYISAAALNEADRANSELKNFNSHIVLSNYHALAKENYVKNLFSIIIPNNDNSTQIISGLGIDSRHISQESKIPYYIPKLNFRSLLAAEIKENDDIWRLNLLPRLVAQANGAKKIHLIDSLSRNGEEIEELRPCLSIYERLRKKLAEQCREINSKKVLSRLKTARVFELNFPEFARFARDIKNALERFKLSHTTIQKALIAAIQNYLRQLWDSRLDLPAPVRIAAALDACQNEALNTNDITLRIIEDITYVADYIFDQNITSAKLRLFGQPQAIVCPHFTVEDVLQIHIFFAETAQPTLISSWEPDFIPQEAKLSSKTLRNDDAQELCSLLGIGYYISDDAVELLARKQPRNIVMTISNDESWHNGRTTYTGATIIINTPAEAKRFTSAYNKIFKANEVNMSSRELFHEHRLLLGEIYAKIVRRMLTHHNQYELMLECSPAEYAAHLAKVLANVMPDKYNILSETDLANISAARDVCIQTALKEQARLKTLFAARRI